MVSGIALAWLVTLGVAFALGFYWQHRPRVAVNSEALQDVKKDNEALLQRVAVLQRAEQVAHTAAAGLQQALRDRQEEIAGLRADLAFYSRLTDGSGKPEGLNVHGVQINPGHGPRVYDFSVTLTQTLRTGPVSKGHVSVSVSGVHDGKLSTLPWTELAPNQPADGLPFSFKYFQQVTGAFMLPAGFNPNRIRVVADASNNGGHVAQEFAWADALADQEIPNVQHQP